MRRMTLDINQRNYTVDVDPEMPLLWVIRNHIGLTGTKYGCGIGHCGACMVHVDGKPIRSCLQAVAGMEGKRITTIEGISESNDHPVQQAWIEAQVPQCGYCQSGQIMAAVAFLEGNPRPSDKEIENAMNGVLCRCGTYPRIKRALKKLTSELDP